MQVIQVQAFKVWLSNHLTSFSIILGKNKKEQSVDLAKGGPSDTMMTIMGKSVTLKKFIPVTAIS